MTNASAPARAFCDFWLGSAAWRAHEGGVTAGLVILLALIAIASLGARRGGSRPAPKRPQKKRPALSPYWLLGAVLLGLVLLRFGVNWIVVAAGMVAALLRGL